MTIWICVWLYLLGAWKVGSLYGSARVVMGLPLNVRVWLWQVVLWPLSPGLEWFIAARRLLRLSLAERRRLARGDPDPGEPWSAE